MSVSVEPMYVDCANCWEFDIPESAAFTIWSEWDDCFKVVCKNCFDYADLALA